jgi:uroporphyrinogen-III synthase
MTTSTPPPRGTPPKEAEPPTEKPTQELPPLDPPQQDMPHQDPHDEPPQDQLPALLLRQVPAWDDHKTPAGEAPPSSIASHPSAASPRLQSWNALEPPPTGPRQVDRREAAPPAGLGLAGEGMAASPPAGPGLAGEREAAPAPAALGLAGEKVAASPPAGPGLAGEREAAPKSAGSGLAGEKVAGSPPAGPQLAGEREAAPKSAGSGLAGERVAGSPPAGPRLAGEREAAPAPAALGLAGERVAGSPPAGPGLAGERVVVTRAERQAGELCAALTAAGATVELLPLLVVVPPVDPAPLAQAAAELPLFDWVVFASTNAVHSLLSLAGSPPRLRRVAAVGAATAAALRGAGIEPALVAPGGEQNAGGLLAALLNRFDCGQRVLLPQAADALPTLRDGLLAAGIAAVAVTAYEKRLPPQAPARAAQLFGASRIGWVTFTSPSTVRNFASLFGADWPRRRGELRAASIGPVTSAELRRHDVVPAVEAARPETDQLVAAIAATQDRAPKQQNP